MIEKRLDVYFAEAKKHIVLIEEAKSAIGLPIKDYNTLPSLEKFAINALVFRFSKLQDLIGSKIFRAFLEFNRFDVQDKSFLLLLKEIEKEGIIDIDTWDELRKVRNSIAHEYPCEEDELIDALELLISKTPILLEISSKLQERYDEIRKV